MVHAQSKNAIVPLVSWAIDVTITHRGERTEQIVGNAGVLTLPPSPSRAAWWIAPSRSIGRAEIGLGMMGDGLQRCFEIGVAAAAHDRPSLYIDGLDNALALALTLALTLEPVWRWLATTSRKRDLQVFATTHSEECIHAAARAFTALGDDGLRVIRLDRREDRTTAAICDRALVETAAEAGVEIR